MTIRIGSNIASMQAQRALGRSTATLQTIYQQLSSGLRINKASDDAAGLAISSLLNTDTRVFGQAVRNINDGISMFTIAEGATSELKNILFRVRELATQASNGTLSLQQRLALDAEGKALEKEYNRIIDSTEFNGKNVFDESGGALVIQAGYGTAGTLTASADVTLDWGDGPIRVSTDSAGAQATGGVSSNGPLTPDSRYVVFVSSVTNLVSGDTNGVSDIFIKDLLTNETRRVNTNSNGAQATGGASSYAQLSPDGRYLLFQSVATDLVNGDTNGVNDIFIKDLLTNETRRVNTNSNGAQVSGGPSSNAQFTPDGRYVVFDSDATNLISGDTNGVSDIFIKDLLTNEIGRINTDSAGAQVSGGGSLGAQVTPDGRYVVFSSNATNLVSGDTNGQFDVFIKDLLTNQTSRVSANSAGAQASGGVSANVQVTPDGRYVVFTSTATNLVSGDTNGVSDIFVKDLLTREISRVNTDSSGNPTTVGSSVEPQITPDGRYVVFKSFDPNLVSGDTNGNYDIFIKDLLTNETRRLSANSSGAEATGGESAMPLITPDGRYVTFYSLATNLVSGDTNGNYDAFVVGNPFADRYSLNKLYGVSLQTQSGSQWMQTYIDRQLNDLGQYQGELGAVQQRMYVAANVLSVIREDSTAAAARITDADVAEQSSFLTRTQILQQAASAVLAQANQQPVLAVRLLAN